LRIGYPAAQEDQLSNGGCQIKFAVGIYVFPPTAGDHERAASGAREGASPLTAGRR